MAYTLIDDAPKAKFTLLDDSPVGAGDTPSTMLGGIRGAAESILEPAVAIGTGLIGSTVGNIAGMGREMLTGDFGKGTAEKTASSIRDAMTYQPRSQGARDNLQSVGKMMSASKLEGLPMAGQELPMIAKAIKQQAPLINAGIGAESEIVGGGLSSVKNAAQRAITPTLSPEAVALAGKAKMYGIPLRPDMLTNNSIIKMVGELLEKVPASGAKAAERQTAFNRAVMDSIGADKTTGKLTTDVFNTAMKTSGSKIGDIAKRNPITVTDDFVTKLANHADEVSKYGTDESARVVTNYVDELLSKSVDGVIPGEAFKSISTKLGRQISGAADKYPLMELQTIMHDGLAKTLSPDDLASLAQARKFYYNGKTIEPLVAKAQFGDVSPAGLMQSVTANKSMKASMARGTRGELGDIARVGQFIKEPGSSNTTERAIAAGLLGGGSMINPTTAGAVYAGANLYNRASPWLTDFLMQSQRGLLNP